MLDPTIISVEQVAYSIGVLQQLPAICRDRMATPADAPNCIHCWAVVSHAFRPGDELAADATERVLYHLANQDCEGAVQLRRENAFRMLSG